MTEQHETGVAFAAIVLAIFIGISGWLFGFYQGEGRYDEVTHVLVPLVGAIGIAILVGHRLDIAARRHRALAIALVTSATVMLAVLWEIAEWVYDLSVPANAILDKHDTMLDLVLGIGGATLGAVIGIVLVTRR